MARSGVPMSITDLSSIRMIVCEHCGNKRCPHAEGHDLPGQPKAIQETLERTWKAQGLAVRPDHAMIGHTGFLVVSRAMAEGFAALRKRDRATKDTTTDIDSLTPEQREAQLDDLELRDISDHKLRKVLRDLDLQTSRLSQDDQACEQGEATAI